jgi:serine/tyrosine/threonine adenylyltransferase
MDTPWSGHRLNAAAPALPHLGTPFDNSYARDLSSLCVPWPPRAAPAPRWLRFNAALATSLGLDAERLSGPDGLAVFSGQAVPTGAQPVAQAYAGHQFGGFSPQLGDGRALLLGEIIDPRGQRHDIAFKGSGPTPFSRGGDGKAAVGPVLREYLISEAMHALGIPTTRTLAAVATGETVRRDRPLPGAVLTRTASSHVRVGTFQFFATRQDTDALQRLARYVVDRHCPEAAQKPDPALALLQAVIERQAALIAQWMGVGFVHGVMNTDNMTVSGETIDYGPCAFMEAHDPDTVFSSIDHQGRYAYGNQPGIAQWNLARFAETLLPLVDTDADAAVALATEAINHYPAVYHRHWLAVFRRKLGLAEMATVNADDVAHDAADATLINSYLALLHTWQVDHTLGFRCLSGVLRGQAEPLRAIFGQGQEALGSWLQRWEARLALQHHDPLHTAAGMDAVNPIVIPRNHRVEAALDAASDNGDLGPFGALLAAILRPFDDRLTDSVWAQPATPAQSVGYRTFCGT